MSLYFTLFETVSLFVTAFVVNFLVLDGRSNYLEGALLIAAYVIIAYVGIFPSAFPFISYLSCLHYYLVRVAAFYFPGSEEASSVGG